MLPLLCSDGCGKRSYSRCPVRGYQGLPKTEQRVAGLAMILKHHLANLADLSFAKISP